MKNKKIAASLLAVSMLASTALAGCDNTGDSGNSSNPSSAPAGDSGTSSGTSDPKLPGENDPWKQTLTYAEGTTLRMACGYNKANTGMRFSADIAKDGVKLADGKTYHTGDFKPTWQAVMDKLKFKIEDQYTGESASTEWKNWEAKLDQVDFVAGNAAALSAAGNAGQLLNIANYLDSMPYFNAYLKRNPIVRLSITSSTTGTTKGAIYFSPYFDGVNDIERMPLMRTDWVVKLLDGKDEFNPASCGETKDVAYTPYMPTSGKVEIEVVEGNATKKITKDYDTAGNIIDNMNKVGKMSGKDAVKMFREYIDKAYGGYYGETRSNLFVGQNAAWDADELVALLRCVVSNAQTLNGTDKIQGLFTREDAENQRRMDMFRFCGTLFGIRGLESRQDYLYVGADNKLHDARMEEDTYKAIDRMFAMVKEGLISESFVNKQAEKSETMLQNDLGFMHYDYNQTQTVFNETKLNKDGDTGEKYMAAMVPVAIWNDGSGSPKYMRFTESWRSVKTDGWAISLAGLGYTKDNVPKKASELNDKAKALLTLIDYAYSKEGMILMSYGPEAFIKGSETFEFNGEQWPVISDQNAQDLWTYANGNYTNYARQYIGSTLSFVKSQAFEFQCTTAAGKEGAGYISKAIALGTIKHPELALAENPWYTSVPTILPNTDKENTSIQGYADLTTQFSSAKTKDGGNNILCDLIAQGFTLEKFTSTSEAVNTVSETFGGAPVLELKQKAWERLVEYYNSTK